MSLERRKMKIRYAVMESPKHQKEKEARIKSIKMAHASRQIRSAREYLVIANSINGQRRIASRNRINNIIAAKVNTDDVK